MSARAATTGAENTGTVFSCTDNIVSVRIPDDSLIRQGEVCYISVPDGEEVVELMAEVLEVQDNAVVTQVFEPTDGLYFGLPVRFSGELLSVTVGPGMLGTVYDGLQNQLSVLADEDGFLLKRGSRTDSVNHNKKWEFAPSVKVGDTVVAGQGLGAVPENHFSHLIMTPFHLKGSWKVKSIAEAGEYTVLDTMAVLSQGDQEVNVNMLQRLPVKMANRSYLSRLSISDYLPTNLRPVDTLYPVPKGGSASIPGGFGTGKTVLQHAIAKNAEIDIVIVCACGERAGEVVETIIEFPHLDDPKTGRKLSERTVIICNTSSMPTASREASVFVASTLGEYFRLMGLDVLILADSTSRWAQGLREGVSARGEIPGDRGFPADLERSVGLFYARAGRVKTVNDTEGSLTIIGTVSPAGGDFSDPVVQATLSQNQAFWGLNQKRADEKRYPAIDPLQSWSKIAGTVSLEERQAMVSLIRESRETANLMTVTGEEGLSSEAFTRYLLAELFDAVYLQQDSFNDVDALCVVERQKSMFRFLQELCFETNLSFEAETELDEQGQPQVVQTAKEVARDWANRLTQTLRTWNCTKLGDPEAKKLMEQAQELINRHKEA